MSLPAKEQLDKQEAEDLEVLEDEGQKRSAATRLVQLAQRNATLLTTSDNVAFATYNQDGHTETWPINSGEFSEWLSQKHYTMEGKVVSESALKDARRTLAGLAKYEGGKQETFLRVAKYEDGYLIDLCNDLWQVVYVHPGRVEVLDESPVKFYRTSTMLPLPTPDPNAKHTDVDRLHEFVNVGEDTQDLVLADLCECFRPDTPYQILEIIGEHGSGKSDKQRSLVALVDPSTVPLSGRPKSVDDMFVAAATQHIHSMDNLSYLSPDMQDELCRLATGGGRKQRKLYTDADVHALKIKRPVIMNGIDVLATRPDLIDRIIQIQVPPLEDYMPESAFAESFKAAHPIIFSGLLKLFSEALQYVGTFPVPGDLRQQDYLDIGQAISYVRNGDPNCFVDQFREMRNEALSNALESSPAISALVNYIHGCKEYSGPVGRLLKDLMRQEDVRHGARDWPQDRGLKSLMKRFAPALRLGGIQIRSDSQRHADGYHVHIQKIETKSSRHSQRSQNREHRELCELPNGKKNVEFPENGGVRRFWNQELGKVVDVPQPGHPNFVGPLPKGIKATVNDCLATGSTYEPGADG